MIVRERSQEFVLIGQHDHAQLSGWLALLWGNERVAAPPPPRDALYLAAGLHDIGWVPLDRQPLWNQRAQRPYDFIDLPVEVRVEHYRQGLDLVEGLDAYAALLCSRHYLSFFPSQAAPGLSETERSFIGGERARQRRLQSQLQQSGRTRELARCDFDLALLKLWDALSLYVALNEPGSAKAAEHPWYRHGFPPLPPHPEGTDAPGQPLRLTARWLDDQRVALDPFPLREPATYMLPYKVVSKVEVARLGFPRALAQASEARQRVRFVPAQA
ncbi:MAG TPA: DUF3891 family protein [Bacillota bacterium]